MNIFPTDTVTTVTTSVTGFLTDNMAVIVGLVAFFVGLKLVLRLFHKGTKGKI